MSNMASENELLASWKGQLRLSEPCLHFLGTEDAGMAIVQSECTAWLLGVGWWVLSAMVINVNNKRLELISSS